MANRRQAEERKSRKRLPPQLTLKLLSSSRRDSIRCCNYFGRRNRSLFAFRALVSVSCLILSDSVVSNNNVYMFTATDFMADLRKKIDRDA